MLISLFGLYEGTIVGSFNVLRAETLSRYLATEWSRKIFGLATMLCTAARESRPKNGQARIKLPFAWTIDTSQFSHLDYG